MASYSPVKSAVRSALETEVKKRKFKGRYSISKFEIIGDDWDELVREMKIEKLRNGNCYQISLPSYVQVRIKILELKVATLKTVIVTGALVGGGIVGASGLGIGAVAGSVVPGIGNIVGSGVGGVVGAGVGGVVGGVVGFVAHLVGSKSLESITIIAKDILSNLSDFYEKGTSIYATVNL